MTSTGWAAASAWCSSPTSWATAWAAWWRGLLLLDLAGTAGTLKLLVAIGLAFAVLQLAGPRATRWAYLPAAVLVAGLLFFPGGDAFWRRLHGLTTETAIVAEDKTGLSLLKMSRP